MTNFVLTVTGLIRGKNYFGVEEGSGDAGGDGEEFGLAGEDFDLAGAGYVGKVDGASAADAGGGGFVGGDRGKLREQLARVDEEGVDGSGFSGVRDLREVGREVEWVLVDAGSCDKGRDSSTRARIPSHSLRMTGGELAAAGFDFLNGVGLSDVEFGDRGAAEGFEMGAAAEALAHLMGDGAHVGPGGDAGAEVRAVGVGGCDGKFFYLHLNRLQNHFFLFARKFVGRDAVDFFGGERRGDLVDEAEESGGKFLQVLERMGDGARVGDRFAVGVISIGREAEADDAFVSFFGSYVELGEARQRAGDEWEDAGGEGVKGAEMADGALL